MWNKKMLYENKIKQIVKEIRKEKQQPTTTEQMVYYSYLNYLTTEKN